MGVIISHCVMMALFLLMGLLALLRRKYEYPDNSLTWFLLYFLLLMVIFTSVGIAIFDQLVTSSISPFLIACIGVAVIFLIRPRIALPMFLLAFLLFYFLMPLTQETGNILLSNRVNALSIAGISFLLSLIRWRNNWSVLNQAMIIEEQKQELENKNIELNRQASKLKELNANKDKLFSIIAHDLTSPFNSIMGFSDLLKSEASHLNVNDVEEYATHINNAAHQTHQLLKNLLAWAGMQQGRMDFKPVKLALFEAGNDIIQLLDNYAKQKKIKTQNSIPEGLTANADPDMLHAILRNLVSNAIRFTPAGGWLELSATESPDEVIVSVKDNGIGISEQNISLLFDVEKNFTMPGTANEKGTGLGLVLCKEFVEKHGGKIWVESEEGKGSAFSFALPCK
jgi:signal transduction histidine kinase